MNIQALTGKICDAVDAARSCARLNFFSPIDLSGSHLSETRYKRLPAERFSSGEHSESHL
jgi:hypothetical protein